MPVLPCAHPAQHSTLSVEARLNRACPSSSGVVISDGVDVPPAWRCESCRQTTLVDGVVPRSRAPRAADSASRISPLSFDGNKRGRMRQFYEAVAYDQKFLWSNVSLRLLADPRAVPYLGRNLPLGATTSSACPIVADRVSMLRKAAVVPLDDWYWRRRHFGYRLERRPQHQRVRKRVYALKRVAVEACDQVVVFLNNHVM